MGARGKVWMWVLGIDVGTNSRDTINHLLIAQARLLEYLWGHSPLLSYITSADPSLGLIPLPFCRWGQGVTRSLLTLEETGP